MLLLLPLSLLLLGSGAAAGGDAKNFDALASLQLVAASKEGDLEGAARALTDGADPDATDSRGFTALMLAGWHGHTTVIKALVAFGAALDAQNKHWSALALACEGHGTEGAPEGQPGPVGALLNAGANPMLQDANGYTALMRADDPETYKLVVAAEKKWQAAAAARGEDPEGSKGDAGGPGSKEEL